MSKVIKFPEPALKPSEEEGRIAQGTAKCMECKHEWEHEEPVENKFFECPECSLHKAKFKYPFDLEEGTYVAVCKRCDNMFMYITPEYHMCANCGEVMIY